MPTSFDEQNEPVRPGVKSSSYLEYIYVNAAANGELRILSRLNGERIDINCRDNVGKTALHWACQNGQYHVVKYLLANNANINVVDGDLVTPLHLAVKFGHLKCVQLLVLARANIEALTKSGCKPKHFCHYQTDIWWVLIKAEDEIYPDPTTFPGPSDIPFVPKYALTTRPETPENEKKRKAAATKSSKKKK